MAMFAMSWGVGSIAIQLRCDPIARLKRYLPKSHHGLATKGWLGRSGGRTSTDERPMAPRCKRVGSLEAIFCMTLWCKMGYS